MIIYILMACIPLVVTGFYQNMGLLFPARRKKVIITCAFFLLLFLGLRSMYVGSIDCVRYSSLWHRLSQINFAEFVQFAKASRTEIGFLAWEWGFSHIFSNTQALFWLHGLIVVVCVSIYLFRNSDNILLSYTMFICLELMCFMMQGLRQAIAMSICIVSIKYIQERKLIKFILMVLFACSFHQTAIVFLLLYFVYGLKVNSKTVLISMVTVGVLLALSNQLLRIANNFFDRDYNDDVSSGGFVSVAIYLMIIVFAILSTKNTERDIDFSFFYFMTLLGATAYAMRYFGTRAAERISYYFMFGQMIVLPKSIKHLSEKSAVLILVTAWGLCLLLFAYRLHGSNMVPYLFFWQN